MTKLADSTAAGGQADLKQILGAMLFGASSPVSVSDMRRVFARVSEQQGGSTREFDRVTEANILAGLDRLKADLTERRMGLRLVEVAGGFRLQTDAECGAWLRELLDVSKPQRLSRPALETLAIIAYRQPVTRAEIEAVRGVSVDSIVRHLLEIQVVRILGRSDLPGRPMLYRTTQLFLEHFGLKDLKNLPGIDELSGRPQRIVEKHERGADASMTNDEIPKSE